jgi:hypothetical protein
MTAPGASPIRAVAVAEVLSRGTQYWIIVKGDHLTANTRHDVYAVWLYKSPTDARLLGFVSPGVGRSGRLSTEGVLPAGAAGYEQILITLERTTNPKRPGAIVLRGAFRE